MNFRTALRFSLFVAALLVGATTRPQAPASSASGESVAALQEVRIRKLHLVRPDLIPYPLYFEVLC